MLYKGLSIGALLVVMWTPVQTLAGQASCANHGSPGFRNYLPDCRAYELVTPAYKESMLTGLAEIGEEDIERGASRLLIRSFGSFSGVEYQPGLGALYDVELNIVGGWRSMPLDAPFSTFRTFDVKATSPDFARSLWIGGTSANVEDQDIYLHSSDGTLTKVGPGGPTSAQRLILNFAGASSDLSHIAFQAVTPNSAGVASGEVSIWPGDKTVGESELSLYEYVGAGNIEPTLVGVSNNGITNIGESVLISQCGTYLGSIGGDSYNAVSYDGSKVFFTALGRDVGRTCELVPAEDVVPAFSEVYARVNNGEQDAHTVAVSRPTAKDCEACDLSNPARAQFQGASLDGSKVFFTTSQPLLRTTGAGEDLYEYNFNGTGGKRVALLSLGDVGGAKVQGVVRVSEDGSHVYFVAHGVLTGALNAYGAAAEEGAENLYVSTQECPSGGSDCSEPQRRLSFIGRLSEQDSQDWSGEDARPAQATYDGRNLVFVSRAGLTPDQQGQEEEAGQVFEFDAQMGTLVRVSRGEDGYNNDGNSTLYAATIPIHSYSRSDGPTGRFTGLAISGDGAYIFFTSEDNLTPGASAGDLNVYEYHNGGIALISDGHDPSVVNGHSGVELLGTDDSGRDVFFETADELLPQDVDTQQDIYDARIEGGPKVTLPPASCLSDGCQGPLASALATGVMPSTSMSPGENSVSPVSNMALKRKSLPRRPMKKAKKSRRRSRTGKSKRLIRRGR